MLSYQSTFESRAAVARPERCSTSRSSAGRSRPRHAKPDGAALAADPLSYRLETVYDHVRSRHTGRCSAYLKDIIRTSSSHSTRTGLRSASSSK